MAEAAVEFAIENLTNLLDREANLLIGVNEKKKWIKTELQFMAAHLQKFDALHQIPRNVNDCMEETRSILRRTENVIETYAKREALSKMANPFERSFYGIKKISLARDLEKIKDEFIGVRERWKSVDFVNQDLATSSSHNVSLGSAGIRKLDGELQQRKDVYSLYGAALKRSRWVRDELVHLHNFLLETDRVSLELLSERHKVWIQELKNIFQFVDESFASLESSSFLSCSQGLKSEKYDETIFEIQNKIFQLYRRYYVYGVGEIQVNIDGESRSIFPRIRMDRALIASALKNEIQPLSHH